MVKKICRLCFKKANQLIGIFTAKGIELNIAEILRLHFPDEIDVKDEFLPKFICPDCWMKSNYFHEFYNSVAEAKRRYLRKAAKRSEKPTFIEVDCNLAENDCDMPFIKVETIIEEDPSSIDPKRNGFDIENRFEHGSSSADLVNAMESVKNEEFVGLECDENESTESAAKFESTAEAALDAEAKLAIKIFEKSSKSKSDEFMKLIPNYFDMRCELCECDFTTLNQVYTHYRYNHDNAKIQVKCCPDRISSADLREHILFHLNPDIYKCKECGKKFRLGRQYRLHIQTHRRLAMECDICKKKFNAKRGLLKHMRCAHGRDKGRFECETCGKRFNSKPTMEDHVKKEHQNIRHVCHVCAKVYKTVTGLQAHLRSHGDKKPRIKCKMCDNLFINMYRLRLHQAKDHEHAKLLQCPHCPIQKTNLFQMKKHVAHSHNYRVHKCDLCEREFRSPAQVSRHMKIHITRVLFKCEYCPKQYSQQRDVTKHMKTMHAIEWEASRDQHRDL